MGDDEVLGYTFKTLESEKNIWAYSHEPVQQVSVKYADLPAVLTGLQGTEVVGHDTGAVYRIISAEPPADRFM